MTSKTSKPKHLRQALQQLEQALENWETTAQKRKGSVKEPEETDTHLSPQTEELFQKLKKQIQRLSQNS